MEFSISVSFQVAWEEDERGFCQGSWDRQRRVPYRARPRPPTRPRKKHRLSRTNTSTILLGGFPFQPASHKSPPFHLSRCDQTGSSRPEPVRGQRADGDYENVVERVPFGARNARVFELVEAMAEAQFFGHRQLLPIHPAKVHMIGWPFDAIARL